MNIARQQDGDRIVCWVFSNHRAQILIQILCRVTYSSFWCDKSEHWNPERALPLRFYDSHAFGGFLHIHIFLVIFRQSIIVLLLINHFSQGFRFNSEYPIMNSPNLSTTQFINSLLVLWSLRSRFTVIKWFMEDAKLRTALSWHGFPGRSELLPTWEGLPDIAWQIIRHLCHPLY